MGVSIPKVICILNWESFPFYSFSAADLGHGLNERPRLRQARLFRDWADETLQIMKVRVLCCSDGSALTIALRRTSCRRTLRFKRGLAASESIRDSCLTDTLAGEDKI